MSKNEKEPVLRFKKDIITVQAGVNRYGKIFYRTSSGELRSKKDIEDSLGITVRSQNGLRNENQGRLGMNTPVERMLSLAEFLGYNFEDIFCKEDIENIKKDTMKRISEVKGAE